MRGTQTQNENVRKGKTKEKYEKIRIAGFFPAFVLLLFATKERDN